MRNLKAYKFATRQIPQQTNLVMNGQKQFTTGYFTSALQQVNSGFNLWLVYLKHALGELKATPTKRDFFAPLWEKSANRIRFYQLR